MLTWFFYTLLASLLWGIGQIFVKKGYNQISSLWNIIIATIASLLFWLPFSVINGINLLSVPFFPYFILLIISAIFYQVYYYALEKGEISITGTVMSAYPLTTLVLSRIFLGELTSWLQKLAIVTVLLGAVVISLPNKKIKTAVKVSSWLGWAIASVLLVGSADFFAKVIINNIGPFNYMFLLPLFYIPVIFVFAAIDKRGRKLPPLNKNNFSQFLPSIIGVSMIEIGIIFFNMGFAHGPASLVGPLSSSYAAITVILALIFLKEKLTKAQTLGIILTITGITLFSIN